MRSAFILALVLAAESVALGQDPTVVSTLRSFDEAKPSDASLAFYSLDWVCSLGEAKERAKEENRFILLILNTNITAHCDFYSGHT